MADDLLLELNRRGIRLRLADDRLQVLAPPGALTAELQEHLRSRREELVVMLRDHGSSGAATEGITPKPEQRYEPFELTDIQHAYWVGRSAAVELGGVSCHYYTELERNGLDPRRLTDSLR